MRKIIWLILSMLLISTVSATYLGQKKAGDKIAVLIQFTNLTGGVSTATSPAIQVMNTSFLYTSSALSAVTGMVGTYSATVTVDDSLGYGVWHIRANGTVDGVPTAGMAYTFDYVENDTHDIAEDVWNYSVRSVNTNDTQKILDNISQYGDDKWTTGGTTNDTAQILTYGDANWATATGFSVGNDTQSIIENITQYGDDKWITGGTSNDTAQIITYGDANWATAVGFSTGNDTQTILDRGNSAWITATGFCVGNDTQTILDHGDSNWFTAELFSSINITSIWAAATRSLTTNDSQTILDNLTQYGDDKWITGGTSNDTAQIITYGDANWATATGFMTSQYMNDTHGNSLYNASSTASISAGDMVEIANLTFNQLMQNSTENYYNDSDGYPTYTDIIYDGGIWVNITYIYYNDSVIISNRTSTRYP